MRIVFFIVYGFMIIMIDLAMTYPTLSTFNSPILQHVPLRIGNPLRLVGVAVVIHHHGVAKGLHLPCPLIHKPLHHLEAGVAHLEDRRLAHQLVMEPDRQPEVEIDMDQHILKGEPIDLGVEDMLEVAASTHVEVVALRPVVDVVVRIQVAHADLDGTREHIFSF